MKELDEDSKWRGHLDGINGDGMPYGWALCKDAPQTDVVLDLYIHDILLAKTTTKRNRPDLDRVFQFDQPVNAGFVFDHKSFVPKGALDVLRQFGLELGTVDGLRVCIAGTHLSLRTSRHHADMHLDLTGAVPNILRAASQYLRDALKVGLELDQLRPIDHDILLLSNPLFLPDWYENTHGDVSLSEFGPVEHCRRFATSLQRDTGPWFNTEGYLEAEPAAQNTKLAPPLHYDIYGNSDWWPGQGRFREVLPETSGQCDYAVLIHLYHLDTVPDLQSFLKNFAKEVDVYISVPEDSPDHNPEQIVELFPQAREILTVPNRGQDIGAFLETVRRIKGRGYKFFCKAHSKKGNKYPDTWRRVMFDALAATPDRVADTVELFRSTPRILMSGPAQFWLNGHDFALSNGPRLEELTARMGFGGGTLIEDWAFFAGTCFWIDAQLAGRVADVISADDFFETEVSQDGQTAHAVERLFSLVVTRVGGRVALTDGCDWDAAPTVSENPAKASLRLGQGENAKRFLMRHLLELSAP